MVPLASSLEFIEAKAHGMRSRMYEADRLEGLCDLRTVAQLWHRLFPEATPGDHRDLQRRLLAEHVRELDVVCRYLPAGLVGLFAWMMKRFEIENLKVLLRGWKVRAAVADIVPYLAPRGKGSGVEPGPFLKAQGLADFIALIPEATLRTAAEKGAASYADTGQTFFVECALDMAYYIGLLARQRTLPNPHAEGTEVLAQSEVALYDILTLFRLKLNYGLRYEQAAKFLVPNARHAVALDRLFAFPDFGDMVSFLPRDLLPVGDDRPLLTIADLERALWQRLLQVANHHFYHRVGDLGTAVAFYTIKRMELANLFHIVEGVRYGMSPDAIRQGLLRPR